jgi:hypothetical protein
MAGEDIDVDAAGHPGPGGETGYQTRAQQIDRTGTIGCEDRDLDFNSGCAAQLRVKFEGGGVEAGRGRESRAGDIGGVCAVIAGVAAVVTQILGGLSRVDIPIQPCAGKG